MLVAPSFVRAAVTAPRAIAIGYSDGVPELGTLDAERAVEVIVTLACRVDNPKLADQTHSFVGWALRLAAPYPIIGDEPWLAAIHCIRH